MTLPVACRCGGTKRGGICDRCGAAWKPKDKGGKWRRLYNSARWRATRRGWLANHPLCAQCDRNGVTRPGDQMDHIVPHNGDLSLFWDSDNWQTLCAECHGAKTRRGE